MPTLRAARAVAAPPPNTYEHDPSILAYYRDLVEPFGASVEDELLRAGPNVSHRDLVDRLVADAAADGVNPDLLIVAQALPDITPFTAIAPYLDRCLGGRSTNFGIHNQGLAAPFTALRVISAFQRAGRSREAVLAVLEQTTLPTRFPLVHDNQLADSGVLLVFGTDGGPRVTSIESFPPHAPPVPRLAELAVKDPDRTLVVTGPWWAHGEVAAAVHRHQAGPGTYCTGVWLELARHWCSWQRDHGTVLLCDTDPLSGESHLAVLRSDSGPAR